MTDEIQKTRSPNSPKIDLGKAIEVTKTLYEKIGRSAVKAEIAAGALGYAGMNGAALSTLGAISQYGLIERTGGNVQITPLALKLMHPVDEAQRLKAFREAALAPRVFAMIHEQWNDMAEEVLANHLIHEGFTKDGASKVASVYKLNYEIAKLGERSSIPGQNDTPKTQQQTSSTDAPARDGGGFGDLQKQPAVRPKMLATFKIPVGTAEAEIIFTGDKLEPEDFDALADYVSLFKKQYVRKQSVERNAEAVESFLRSAVPPSPSS